jgi:hypothetical protein
VTLVVRAATIDGIVLVPSVIFTDSTRSQRTCKRMLAVRSRDGGVGGCGGGCGKTKPGADSGPDAPKQEAGTDAGWIKGAMRR